jgi:hypothetical protein
VPAARDIPTFWALMLMTCAWPAIATSAVLADASIGYRQDAYRHLEAAGSAPQRGQANWQEPLLVVRA